MSFPARCVFVLALFTCSTIPLSSFAQLPGTSAIAPDPKAIALLTQAASALQGPTAITDVTLAGSVRRIAGSDDESGTAVLKSAGLNSSVALTLPSGTWSETRSVVKGQPYGTWSGVDGVSHSVPLHNLLTDPAWFFPIFPITRALTPGYLPTYLGRETRNGQDVEHLSISQTFSTFSTKDAPVLAHLSQIDLFLDATTLLPVAIAFNIHPDNDELLDIPIEVRFSDYRVVNGGQIPFRVQKFLNNGLVLDLQFATTAVNTGLMVSQFQQ